MIISQKIRPEHVQRSGFFVIRTPFLYTYVINITDQVTRYLRLRQDRLAIDSEIADLEVKITKYCTDNRRQGFKINGQLLTVVHKTKTVFPPAGSADRRQFDAVLKQFSLNEYKTIDITRLATAYDRKKLSPDLQSALQPFVRSKPFTRISLRPLSST